MGKRFVVNPEMVADMHAKIKKGKSKTQIACEMGLSEATISRHTKGVNAEVVIKPGLLSAGGLTKKQIDHLKGMLEALI